jgi:uncharacterized OB-fold protein
MGDLMKAIAQTKSTEYGEYWGVLYAKWKLITPWKKSCPYCGADSGKATTLSSRGTMEMFTLVRCECGEKYQF